MRTTGNASSLQVALCGESTPATSHAALSPVQIDKAILIRTALQVFDVLSERLPRFLISRTHEPRSPLEVRVCR